ncbi:WXG100 family type VII secretion target [Salinispora arenicola]|uniref:WXG100 family type VII secretion target n=1 Tax=Salinispora arenicola TaxID=168697 RepID=UPI000362DEBA|nr:WXG100 family type VII secretion target [Salinispora arenicola]NIL55656.1 hypothetical protein [Salinispora arenicola]NIL64031.1 hypothetical protein [Salinispora arenicola]
MTESFAVDPERLAKSSDRFADLARRLNGAANALQARLAEVGECWGDDPMGQQFGEVYTSNAAAVAEALGGLGEISAGIRDGVTDMSSGFAHTEQVAGDMASGVDTTTGGRPRR